jgi:hydrogenase maturation protease
VGNVLARDDAVGIRVVEALERAAAEAPGLLPDDTRIVDGGTLGPELLATLEGARGIVLVDAIDLGADAGTVHVLRGDAVAAVTSWGRSGLAETVAIGRLMGWLGMPLALVGIQAAEISIGLGLSPAVERAVPGAVGVVAEVARLLDAPVGMGAAA